MKSKIIGLTGSNGVLGNNLKKQFKNFQFDNFKGDIRSKKDIKAWIKNKKFDGIFHLAAIVPTGKVASNYKKSIKTNYNGTKILIDEVIKNKTTSWFLFTSTSHVYSPSTLKLKETSKISPITKYGETKLKAEKYLIKKNKIKICIVRIFSYTNYDQKQTFLIPSIYQKFKNMNPIVFQDINHVRDFIDVRDITRAIKLLFMKNYTGIFNIATGKPIKLKKIINFFSKKFKKKYILIKSKNNTSLIANISNLKKTGWKPKFNIDSILNKYWNDKKNKKY